MGHNDDNMVYKKSVYHISHQLWNKVHGIVWIWVLLNLIDAIYVMRISWTQNKQYLHGWFGHYKNEYLGSFPNFKNCFKNSLNLKIRRALFWYLWEKIFLFFKFNVFLCSCVEKIKE